MAIQTPRDNTVVDEFNAKFVERTAKEIHDRAADDFKKVDSILKGVPNADQESARTWNDIVADQIEKLSYKYGIEKGDKVASVLAKWHKNVTLDYKYDENFAPHINGFYMIFMVHGPWYKSYQAYVASDDTNKVGLSKMPQLNSNNPNEAKRVLTLENPNSYFNMLATDIDVPDITEEYVSVSSRLRNSFVPSRNYFVSDFSISYIESINLDVIRYHEAWHKYLNLIHRGEINIYAREIPGEGWDDSASTEAECIRRSQGYFVDMPYTNAVWIAVFKPFTTEIQLLIKLMGVMPVTMPLKQIVGNRSASKMTVLNMSYKAADIFYKFYNSTTEFISDTGTLANSFRAEVIDINKVETT